MGEKKPKRRKKKPKLPPVRRTKLSQRLQEALERSESKQQAEDSSS